MAKPDLWARILEALRSEGVDADEFEGCAFVFLKDSFPTLSPVSGGTDFGRDADAINGNDVVRLLATTARDPRDNLRNGLRRMQEEGLPFNDVVLATSQPVSATRRRQLEQIAEEEFGARLVMVYDQTWLAGELYRDAIWRERLLGVTGEPPALTPVPLSLSESHLPAVDLVGREEALSRLGSGNSDLIVVGASGMGKTRLVAEVEDGVFVELHSETARIADDIRRLQPTAVIVDDAQDYLETVDLLRRIRGSESPAFRIVATTWPETVETVRDHLPDADQFVLAPLERSESARILEGLDITNRLLVGDILDQSEGRPGWAVVLGDLARQGGVRRVLTGEALIHQVGRLSRRLAQGPVALDLLARIAALGHVTDEELPKLADEIGLPLADVSEQLRRLARHGLAEWSRGRWAARPPRLRAALVAHHFLSEPPTASIDALIAQWPERTLAIVSSIVAAALVGSANARRRTEPLLQQLANETDLLGDEAADLLYSYALTSPQAASWVVEYLGERFPEGPPSRLTGDGDFLQHLDAYEERARWGRMAAAAEAAAQKFALPGAFDLLARMALQDDGPTNHSDHPRRRLLELPTKVGPYWGTNRDLRREALQCAVRLTRAHDPAAEELASELASAAMSPQGRGTWLDPVDRYKFIWVDRLEGGEQLEWIAEMLWPVWREVVEDLSDAAVGTLLELVRSWQGLQRSVGGRLQATEAAKEVAAWHTTEMLNAVRDRCRRSPGLAMAWNTRFNDLSHSGDMVPIEVDEGFSALVPDLGLNWREREDERRQRIPQIADELAKLDLKEVVKRIDQWMKSAEAAGQHIGMSVGQLLAELGKRIPPTDLLLHALATETLLQHSYALASTALEIEPDRWRDWIPAGLHNPQRRNLVMTVTLTEPSVPDEAILHALDEFDAADARTLEHILIRRDTTDMVAKALLAHEDRVVRAATALEFRLGDMRHGLDLPDSWYTSWQEAFLETSADLSGHAAWRFEEIAQALAGTDPDFLTEWFLRSLDDTEQGLGHDAIELLGELPREGRRRVLTAATDHPARRWLICAAIGTDPDFRPCAPRRKPHRRRRRHLVHHTGSPRNVV